MEKAAQSSAHHVEANSQAPRPGEGLPGGDDGDADPPGIPSAGSTILVNEKSMVGARSHNHNPPTTNDGYTINDVAQAHDWAHTLHSDRVANLIGTNTEYVKITRNSHLTCTD